jgi:DNA-3-methyladenine glycosylase
MRRRRGASAWRRGKPVPPDEALCRGPGNLTVALGITLAHNTARLTRPPLVVLDAGGAPVDVQWTPRIGISVGTEHHWRCAVVGHPAVSGRDAARACSGRAGSRLSRY